MEDGKVFWDLSKNELVTNMQEGKDAELSPAGPSPCPSSRGSRILDVARSEAPTLANTQIATAAAAVQLSRAADGLSIGSGRSMSSTASGVPQRPKQGAKSSSGVVRGIPRHSEGRSSRTPSQSAPLVQSATQSSAAAGKRMARRPSVKSVESDPPKQVPAGRPPLRRQQSRNSYNSSEADSRRSSKHSVQLAPQQSTDSLGEFDLIDPETEEDNTWEEELRRTFNEHIRPISMKHKEVQRSVSAAEQALRRIHIEESKAMKQARSEVEQAQVERDAIEKKSADRSKLMNAGAHKAEAAVEAAHADLVEAQELAVASKQKDASELEELAAKRDAQAELHAATSARARSALAQVEAKEDYWQRCESEVAAEVVEATSLKEAISEAESAICERLRGKLQVEATAVSRVAEVAGAAKCSGLLRQLREQSSLSRTLEAKAKDAFSQLSQSEAAFEGFQKAVKLSGEVARKQLQQDLADLKQEEAALRSQLETLPCNRQAMRQSRSEGTPESKPCQSSETAPGVSPNVGGELWRQTAKAVCQELEEHRALVNQLYRDASASASIGSGFHLSKGSAAEVGGHSSGSSARTQPDLPSSVAPEGSPAVQSTVPWPSSPGSTASAWLRRFPGVGRRAHMPISSPVKAGAWQSAWKRFEVGVNSCEAQLQSLMRTQSIERHSLEASAQSARGACDAALVSLRQAELQRWTMEVEYRQLQMEIASTVHEADMNAGLISDCKSTVALRTAESECLKAEACMAATEAALAEAEAAALASDVGYPAGPSQQTNAGQQASQYASTAGAPSTAQDECPQYQESQTEMHNFRKAETEALRRVAAANAELKKWQDVAESSTKQDMLLPEG